ncbi:uncharacterized protein F5147DRAFT_838490 [Suillus discolor]|uniref:Uncharacterized protein n=1 Tax=Suillus discolor TaxID=1912936 RepID=A0A9P7F434_9AGAM|nr:uncharacterized protein F5147DRAFT_838490 [Suillus discolor]KAG2103792.1 hypothetical protein F5147DRAFT_838490 [Suillus discolor]
MSSNGKDYTYTGHGTNDQAITTAHATTVAAVLDTTILTTTGVITTTTRMGPTYYNSGTGYSQYTTPSGQTHKSNGSSK